MAQYGCLTILFLNILSTHSLIDQENIEVLISNLQLAIHDLNLKVIALQNRTCGKMLLIHFQIANFLPNNMLVSFKDNRVMSKIYPLLLRK